MTRNLKTLALALVAVFAFSAMAASAASATAFTAKEYPVALEGEGIFTKEYPEGPKFELNGNVVTCPSTLFTEGSLSKSSEEIELTPELGETCTASGPLGKIPVTFTLNGCKLRFTILSIHLVCPAGKVVEIHVYSNATNHKNKTSLCTFSVGPQTFNLLKYIFHTNIKRILWTFIKKWIIKRISGSALVCGAAEQEGTYSGEAEIHGTNASEEEVAVDVG